ncbi:hypothetical protein ScKU66_03090 [Streptococcus canis]|nr:hypothetical protein SpKU43_05980 [Streptococcus canis]GMX40237.1 hypothetical protein ScKU71_14600 [Streptococcus canis]
MWRAHKISYRNRKKVESESVEGLELFDKTIKEIVGNDNRFGKFTCIYDGISTSYSTPIYSELHADH